jgi:hypothetical protein
MNGSGLESASASANGPWSHRLQCRSTTSITSTLPITPPKARSADAGHRTPTLAMNSAARSYSTRIMPLAGVDIDAAADGRAVGADGGLRTVLDIFPSMDDGPCKGRAHRDRPL